jgi:hypothetical protein
MKIYVCMRDFSMLGMPSMAEQGDLVYRLDDTVAVIIGGETFTDSSFHAWVGSPSSESLMEYAGESPDPSEGGCVPSAPVDAPDSSTDDGSQGTWAWDGTYLYKCIATDSWVRHAAERTW